MARKEQDDDRTALAKITRPRLFKALLRDRLFRQLDEACRLPMVWVSAPAGAGKTTLMASYLNERRLPCLWYQIDAGDADTASFFYYLGLAAKKVAPRKRKPLPLPTPEYMGDIAAFARNAFRDAFSRLGSPAMVVFDNYQQLPADAPLQGLLAQMVDEVPEGITLVVISRADPPQTFARWRASDRLALLDWEALRLAPEESRAICRSLYDERALPDAVMKKLHAYSEGWAAGLKILLQQPAFSEQLHEIPGRDALFRYFAAELFASADPARRAFLLKTALLPVVEVGMAAELTQEPRAGAILQELASQNYFTLRIAAPRAAYQYHALFRGFLLERGREELLPEDHLALSRKAAGLLQGAGRLEEAAALLRESGDQEGLAGLIPTAAPHLLRTGRFHVLQQWFEAVPEERLERTPWLLYWYGTSLMPFDLHQAQSRFEQAFHGFRRDGDLEGTFLAWAGTVESMMHQLDHLRDLDPWLDLFDELLDAQEGGLPEALEHHLAPKMLMALVLRKPQHPQFALWKAKAQAAFDSEPDHAQRLMTGFYLFTCHIWADELYTAKRVLDALQLMAAVKEASPLARTTAYLAQAWYGWVVGRHEDCVAAVANGLAVAEESGVHLWDFLLSIQGAISSNSTGDPGAGDRFLQPLAPFLNKVRRMDQLAYYHEIAWGAFLRGDLLRARSEQRIALRLAEELGGVYSRAETRFGMCQICHADGNRGERDAYLGQMRALNESLQSEFLEFICRVAEAQFALDDGHLEDVPERIRRALALGRAQGYMNFTWWLPEAMARLCGAALEQGIEVDYVRELIRRRRLALPESFGSVEQWPVPVRVNALGPFSLVLDDREVSFTGKGQKKPLEMLKALIAFGGTNVSEERLSEALWPDADGDNAHRNFTTTLHRLRKLMGSDVLILSGGQLSLDRRYCWVDSWAFERMVDQFDGAYFEGMAGDPSEAIRQSARILALYRGPFLEQDLDQPWALSTRERLRSKLLRHIDALGHLFCDAKACRHALDSYRKGLETDDLAESFYRGLMGCYRCLNRPAEALAVYRRCRDTLRDVLGIHPSPETEALYRSLKPE